MTRPVVIVGGGISGLAAAHELHLRERPFLVLEASDRIGGKIDSGPVAGSGLPFDVDTAADGFLARQPEATDLCRELGLADELVSPTGARAFIWVDGALRPIPAPSVLGVPFDVDSVAASGIVSAPGLADFGARIDAPAPPLTHDMSVGDVMRPRVGDEVFERLVDPLLGGINAGAADELSISAGAAQLADAARAGGSLRDALRSQVAASVAAAGGPVFNGVRGGNRRIVDALADELAGRVHTGCAVEALTREGGAWVLRRGDEAIAADRVILATPAWVTSSLVAPHSAVAAEILGGIAYGSAVLVTFVVDKERVEHPLDGSGFLVPRDQGLLMTACSWSSSKWAHYDDGTHAILRVSAGRIDDPRWIDLDPATLVATLGDELTTTVGLHGDPAVRVTPWHRSLPQYRPGHLDRCDEVEHALRADAPGLHVTGAQMRGLGLPACVRQGRAAAIAALG